MTEKCALSIGYVIFDSICLFIGATALRSSLTAEAAEDVAKAAEPVLSQMEKYIVTLADEEASATEHASAVFNIMSTIWSGGCLPAVIAAFAKTLTPLNATLYGATAVGTIVAAFATDGAAMIGEIVVELATFGFLVEDSINCSKECSY